MQDIKGQLTRFPTSGVGGRMMAAVRQTRVQNKGAAISATWQLQPYQRKDCVFLVFEDEVGITVNIKQRKMTGSALIWTSWKAVGRLWPTSAASGACTVSFFSVFVKSNENYFLLHEMEEFLYYLSGVEPGHQYFLKKSPQVIITCD